MAALTPEWLELEKSIGARPCLDGTPAEMHEQYNGLIEMLLPSMPPPDPDIVRKEQTIQGTRCVIFTPANAGGKKLPICVYFHGGGFVVGNPEGEAVIAELVAKHTPAVVVSVDYRKGPTHKHPSALEDGKKVWEWCVENAAEIGGDNATMFTMGGSAGAGLALSLTNYVVSKPETRSRVKGCVAIVPVSLHPDNVPADYESMYKSYTENAKDVPVINKNSMMEFYKAVDADPKDANNFVGLASENHKYFPPTYFAACEKDPLRDDSFVMQKMLDKAGVKTKLDFYKGLPHYFWIFSSIPEGATFVGNMLEGVKFVLSN